MKLIGFIPARRGSRGVPGKSLITGPKLPNGLTLIEQCLKTANESKVFDEVHISTNDDETLTWAHEFTDTHPYGRHNEHPYREASMKEVLLTWALDAKIELHEVAVFLLYVTYPNRTAEHLQDIRNFWQQSPESPVIGLKEPKTHPMRCVAINPDSGELHPIVKGAFSIARRQEYPVVWELSHFACVIPGGLLPDMSAKLMHPNMRVWWLPPGVEQDIDTAEDMENAKGS